MNKNGNITNYTLNGNKIIQEYKVNDDILLKYFYDSNGSIIGFTYSDSNQQEQIYRYIKNLQNDIIGIVNEDGNVLVEYVYDSYGNILYQYDSSGIGLANINPFRFKSYYYDNETKFYYLNSRYYDPSIGRFINADDISMLSMGETNLFSYCGNDPVLGYDPMGFVDWKKFWITTVSSLAFGPHGFIVSSNIYTVIETNNYVKKIKI